MVHCLTSNGGVLCAFRLNAGLLRHASLGARTIFYFLLSFLRYTSRELSIMAGGVAMLFLLLFSPVVANATDYSTDNNCSNITLSDIRTQFGDVVTTADSSTINNTYKYFALTTITDNCTTINSNNSIQFCWDTTGASYGGTCPNSKKITMTAGQDATYNDVWLRAVTYNTYICVQAYSYSSSVPGWVTLGCKDNYPSDPGAYVPPTSCFIDSSCVNAAARHSKMFFSLSGVVVECFQQTLQHVFSDNGGCLGRDTLFTKFKNAMRKTVGVVLSIYVMFCGIKIILGEYLPSKGEVFMFAMKMILVMYFSVGDGVNDFLYPSFVSSMTDLVGIMFDAGSGAGYDAEGNVISRGFCEFKGEDYPSKYVGMAVWDSIDCRIAFYMLVSPNGVPVFIAMMIPALISGQVLFFIFSMMFGIFLMSILVYVIHNFIASLIIITLVAYLAPIFVPMALFSYTKKYYDNWIRSLLFGTLQPLVLFAFVALLMTVFDQLFYADCTFNRQVQAGGMYYFSVDEAAASDACKSSMGYVMNKIANDGFLEVQRSWVNSIMFSNSKRVGDDSAQIKQLMVLALFGYLFRYFIEIVVSIAEDLIGGPQAQALVSTTPMMFKEWADQKGKDFGKMALGAMVGKEKVQKMTGEDPTVGRGNVGGLNNSGKDDGGGGGGSQDGDNDAPSLLSGGNEKSGGGDISGVIDKAESK